MASSPEFVTAHGHDSSNLKERKSNSEHSVSYIGHATVLINMADTSFLTDPVFRQGIFGNLIRRHQEPGRNLDEISTDAVLLSHDHPDHWDEKALQHLAHKQIPVISPQSLQRKLRRIGFDDIRALEPWEQTRINKVSVFAVPAAHAFSKSCGFVIKDGQKAVYFPGDTGLFEDMSWLKGFNIDLALLPIGDSRPSISILIPPAENWNRAHRHMGPADVPIALEWLGAKTAIPIHHGVFRMTIHPLDEPRRVLERVIIEHDLSDRVLMLQPGDSISF